MDELIAWTTIPIPNQIYKGVTIEQWYNLTGKQGPNNEGTINIIISFGVSIQFFFNENYNSVVTLYYIRVTKVIY